MTKTYIKPTWTVRRTVRAMLARNRKEDRDPTFAQLRATERLKILKLCPDIREDDLERKVDRIMARGKAFTQDVVPNPAAIPEGALAVTFQAAALIVDARATIAIEQP